MKQLFPIDLKSNQIIEIKVKTNSSQSKIQYNKITNKIEVFVHSIPENNKANEEIIKLFKKQLKLKIEIILGLKSKNKKIKIL